MTKTVDFTSISLSKELREKLRKLKLETGLPYNELLKKMIDQYGPTRRA